MRCLIVDDNIIARTTLAQLATHVNDLIVVDECADAFSAWNILKEHAIDLILLDIEMDGLSGLELTKNIGRNGPLIIFISSKKDYAMDAFELNVVDYILKPVMPARFIQAIDRAREVLDSRNEKTDIKNDEFIFIRDSNIVKRVAIDEILFVEAMGDYVKLHLSKRYFAIHKGLKDIEERLPYDRFIRVHRSYIVALDKIDYIEQGVLMVSGKSVPVADSYRNTLNKRLNVL